jgi:hypothetical protein
MKRQILSILFIIALQVIIPVKSALSQVKPEIIKGKIVNENKQGISEATIKLIDEKDYQIATTVSNAEGRFQFSIEIKSKYKLKISHTGYKTYTSALFNTDTKDFGTITLLTDTKNLSEVVVESKQNPVTLDGNTLVFNVSKTISAQGTNALEVLKKAPGVFVDNNESISLNGKSGAMILLDGKQTYLSSKEIADLLKSMPSSQIKSIEIVNSPSAKYDAAGTAGIINIKTTKSTIKGFNGNLTTGLTYGVIVKQNQDLSFNYRKEKINVFGSYNHFFGNYKYLYGTNRIQGGSNYISDTDDTDKRKKMGSRLGVDYNLDNKNTVGLLLTGNFIFGGGLTDTHTQLVNLQQDLDAVNDYYYQNTQRYNANINYKYEDTLGHVFNIDADYGYYQKDNKNLQNNRYTNAQQQVLNENIYRTINGASIDLNAIKVDYAANLWKGKFETGAKYSSIATSNDSKFYHVLSTLEAFDERKSNQFNFKEEIASSYINYKRPVGNWVLQAGLRLENTTSNGALTYKLSGVLTSENIKRNYTNLFPSASLSVKLSKNHNLSFGYARRIDRPAYQDLNPFVYLLDELSFWSGNPFLKPQLSHRGNVLYVYKSTTIIGLNYAYSTNFKANITDTIDVNKIMLVPKNVGKQQNFSLTLTQLITPAKWWDITLNATLYRLQNQISLDQYRNFNLTQNAGRASLQQTFKLPFKFTGEVFNTYNSKRLIGANEVINATHTLDLGLQRSLLDKRATLRLIYSDIYRGSRSNSQQSFQDFNLRSYAYYETRQIRINFSYKFADATVKGPRNRNSALENENGRIK